MFENMNSFRQSMQSIFADCPDYICRELSLCGADAVVLTIRELADKEYIADSVIRPMLEKTTGAVSAEISAPYCARRK